MNLSTYQWIIFPWDCDNNKILNLIDLIVWSITLRNVLPSLVPSGVSDFVGKTNSTAIKSVRWNRVFPPETLQWMEPQRQEAPAAELVVGQHLTIPLAYDPGGWNNLYRPGTDFALGKVPYYDKTGTVQKKMPPVDFRSVLEMFPAS